MSIRRWRREGIFDIFQDLESVHYLCLRKLSQRHPLGIDVELFQRCVERANVENEVNQLLDALGKVRWRDVLFGNG